MIERKKEMGRDRVSRLVSWGHWFAFFNGFLAMIVGVRYIQTVGAPESWIGWGYLTISTLGHFSFLAFIVYLVVLFPISLILPYSKILRGLAAIAATLGLCILLYDTIIYDDYGLHLSPFVFDIAWADLNALLQGTSYIVTPLGILILELTAANFLWKRIEKIRKSNYGNKVVLFIGACFVSSHLIHIWADAADVSEITRLDDIYPLSYPATARTFMERHGIEKMQSDNRASHLKPTLNYPIAPLQCSSDDKLNILLITIDGFRADMVDEHTMPFLNQYASQHTSFSQHHSGGNINSSGMFSLLYSLQGSYISAHDLDYRSPVFTQELKQQGYNLALFSPDMQDVVPGAIFQDLQQHTQDKTDGIASADIHSVDAFNTWYQTQQQPWFALINLQSPDSYDTPIGFLGIETVKPKQPLKAAQKVLFNQYRQSLNFIDGQLENLLSELPEQTLVLITGVSGKVFTSDSDQQRTDLSPANVNVPLVISWPGLNKRKLIDYPTSHYGIVPTLMTQALNCTNNPQDYSSGHSLLQPSTSNWTYVGDNLVFGIYQQDEITVIDRHGKYRIYDKDYNKRLRKKISAPEFIQVMRESRRFYNH
ncbi:DUF3413 domain-containing protein [Shewanella sp. Isolate11]|uniref:DUF3413 domain-containing protein n=1 Tax=Shewanella sp. Isolate11 TaxID=2908530 RepID=UPI001EFCBD6C|nr:DUF3413 domain-containing protein [Shewanella sp. Isolate11]MCG9697093.1 DUF3413 domain-containing protein [Shewanella sp. Isolate11]